MGVVDEDDSEYEEDSEVDEELEAEDREATAAMLSFLASCPTGSNLSDLRVLYDGF